MSISNVKHRPNKVAKGFTKHYEQRENKGRQVRLWLANSNKSSDLSSLIVRGTTDHLAGGKWLYIKKIKVEHPIDKGYFKEVYVLTDKGKARLKTLKRFKGNNFPFWEYMHKTDTN